MRHGGNEPMWDESSLWPSDVLGRYRNILVNASGVVTAAIAIRRYRNNDAGSHPTPAKAGTQDALKIKDALMGVAPGAIAKAGGAQNYVNVFTGKGSPAAITGVLQAMVDYSAPFITKYLKSSYPYSFVAQQMDDPSLSWAEALQNIADEFLGLDCNGFVGNWILLCDKTLKLTEQSNPPVVKNAAKKRRMKFEDIEEWDVVIWDDMSHIAVIEQPSLDPATGKVTMIQSAGEGPISHEYIFTQGTVGSGLFNKTGGGPPQKEVGGPVRVYSLW
jgi:hypothetical protein